MSFCIPLRSLLNCILEMGLIMDIVEMLGFDETFKDKYYVKDCFGSDAAKVLFILESPHIDEIRHKYPAAGKTGDVMSQVLLDNFMCSFGELLNRADPSTEPYGIMNVSQIPLQLSAYQKREKTQSAMITMNRVKNYERTPYDIELHKSEIRRSIATRPVMKLLLKDFFNRYKHAIFTYKPKLIIPCGVFAQVFFEAVQKNPPVLGNSFNCSFEGQPFKVFYMYHPSPKSGDANSSWITKKKLTDNLKKEINECLKG